MSTRRNGLQHKGQRTCLSGIHTPNGPSDSLGWGRLGGTKETEKDARYTHHRYLINYLSAQRGRPWKCTLVNFTVGARGLLKESQFDERLTLLGVSNSKALHSIRTLSVQDLGAIQHYPQTLPHIYSPQSGMALYQHLYVCKHLDCETSSLHKNHWPPLVGS